MTPDRSERKVHSYAARRETVAGRVLAPGNHEISLGLPGTELEVALTVMVGAQRGPRALLIGGIIPGDLLGLAVARVATERIDPRQLAGTLIAVRCASPCNEELEYTSAMTKRLEVLVKTAGKGAESIFGIELRSAPPGRVSFPHVLADLGDERAERLARAFGAEVVVDHGRDESPAPVFAPMLRYEAGSMGLHDSNAVGRAVAGLVNLLRAHRMLPGKPTRPGFRATGKRPAWVSSKNAGWMVPVAKPGDFVDAGNPLAMIYDRTGHLVETVVAPRDGMVVTMATHGHTDGRRIAWLAKLRSQVQASNAALVLASRRLLDRPRIGWCEWVSLPELGIPSLHAKIDTGARTSVLHVRSMRQVGEEAGHPVLDLHLPVGRSPGKGNGTGTRVVALEYVTVRDSGGHTERRPVIETTLVLGHLEHRVRVTLTNRGDMLFPMLIGRTALAEEFIIDPSGRNLLGK